MFGIRGHELSRARSEMMGRVMLYLAMLLFAVTIGAWERYLNAESYWAAEAHTQFIWALSLFGLSLAIGLIRRR